MYDSRFCYKFFDRLLNIGGYMIDLQKISEICKRQCMICNGCPFKVGLECYFINTEPSKWDINMIENRLSGDIKLLDYEAMFNKARKIYPGTKRGNHTEFANFCKKHKDWKTEIYKLMRAVELQVKNDLDLEWVSFEHWINNRGWEYIIGVDNGISCNKD